jgi:Spy/CpxP family protein refolding chaperone
MTRRTKVAVAVTVAVGLLAGATAFAAWGHGGRPAVMKRMVIAMIDDALDAAQVTADQRPRIYAARDRVFAAVEEMRKNRRARMEEVLAVFEADAIDPARLEALRALREEEHRKVADAIAQALVETHEVLSPEQRKALTSYVRSHHQRRHLGQ